jgi:hypothetical protein
VTEPDDGLGGGKDVDIETLIDTEPDEDDAPDELDAEGKIRRRTGHLATLQQFVLERVADGPKDIDALVSAYFGRPISENDRRHARMRQAVARLAWPADFRIPGPRRVTVELPPDRVFGAVTLA